MRAKDIMAESSLVRISVSPQIYMKTSTRLCCSVEYEKPHKNYITIGFLSISKYTNANRIVSSKWRCTSPSKLRSSHDKDGAVLIVKRHRSPWNASDWSCAEECDWLSVLSVTDREGRVQKGVCFVQICRHLPDCSSTYFNSVAVRGENAACPPQPSHINASVT